MTKRLELNSSVHLLRGVLRRPIVLITVGTVILLVGTALFLLVGRIWQPPWHAKDFPERIGLTLIPNSKQPFTGTVSVLIPSDHLTPELPATSLEVQAFEANGQGVAAQLAPETAGSPRVAWLGFSEPSQDGRYFLYFKRTAKPDGEYVPKLPWLLFDSFTDPWMSQWDSETSLAPEQAPLPWMAGLVAYWRMLPPDSGTGYTIEILAQETTFAPGGPAVVVSYSDATMALSRVDENHWSTQVADDNSSETTSSAGTQSNTPAYLRVDVPRTAGMPVRFFINGELIGQAPLPQEATGPVRLFLLRRGSEGVAHFHWLGVRPYQENEPTVILGKPETPEARK